jgi:hypothetical protein
VSRCYAWVNRGCGIRRWRRGLGKGGTRITVEILLEKLSAGASIDEILRDYPSLERQDVLASLAYARAAIGTDELIAEPA